MVDQPKPLTKLDWTIIGRRGRRVQIPLPNDRKGLYTIANRLTGLVMQLQSCARDNVNDRTALIEAASLLKQVNESFRLLQKDWEREWRETQNGVSDAQEGGEHSIPIEATEKTVSREIH